jgi:RNA polymerase sigma-70 factor (ECF subfamily)
MNQIIDDHYNHLIVVAMRYLRDRSRAEDVVQDILLDLWKRREGIEIKGQIGSFLRGAIVNRCLAIIRNNKKIEFKDFSIDFNSLSDVNIDQEYHAKELKAIIDDLINELPERCKQIFLLSREERKRHKEIAELLDISTKTIENQMSKALKHLRLGLFKKGIIREIIIFMSINMIF